MNQAQVMDSATKNVKMHKDIENILNKTSDTLFTGDKYLNVELTDWTDDEKVLTTAELANLKYAMLSSEYFTEAEFQQLKRLVNSEYFTEADFRNLKILLNGQFFTEEEFKQLKKIFNEDEHDDVVIASSAEDLSDDLSFDNVVVSIDTEQDDNDDAAIEENDIISDVDKFLTIDTDSEVDVGVEDGKLSLDTGDTNIKVDIDKFLNDDSELKNSEEDSYIESEKQELKKLRRSLEAVLHQAQHITKKKKSKILNIINKTDLKEMQLLQTRLEKLLNESVTNKSKKNMYNTFDKLTKKFDKLLENAFKEEGDADLINADVNNMSDALDKSEDILNIDNDEFDANIDTTVIDPDDVGEEQTTLHVTLPSGVTSDDIVVKVIEESEDVENAEAPIIQIELPNEANVDEVEVEASVSDELSVDGLDIDEDKDVLKDDESTQLHIALPFGVTSDDVVVKVVESEDNDESPVIQIELPVDTNIDELEVEASVDELLNVDGLDIGDKNDEEQTTLHITLPDEISSDDVVVKVVESEEEGVAPIIQIELPIDTNVDELEVEASIEEPLNVDGLSIGVDDENNADEQAKLHVTLPSGVSSDDVIVKVIEESEEGVAPIIQIELPIEANVDEVGVEASVDSDVSVEGIDKIVVTDDNDLVVDNLADDDILDEDLSKEETDKLEEVYKILNKRLLPVAENARFNGYKANKLVMEAAMKPDTSYNFNILKQTHLYYENDGKKATDYRYPVADVIDGKFYVVPEAISKMTELFSNSHMVKNLSPAIVKIARARLVPYLKLMEREIPWKTRKSNVIVKENGMLLSLIRNREKHDPTLTLKKIRNDMLRENGKV